MEWQPPSLRSGNALNLNNMKTLTIFYDPRCGLCAKFRAWLEAQPKRVAVEFLPYDCTEAALRFPNLLAIGADKDVVVLADDGRWWQGSSAWLACLWTTYEYRAWSFRLAVAEASTSETRDPTHEHVSAFRLGRGRDRARQQCG